MKLPALALLAPAALLLTGASPGHDKPHWTYGGEAGPAENGPMDLRKL